MILGKEKQLTLPVQRHQNLVFESFYGGSNQKNVTLLKRALGDKGESLIFVTGSPGTGKTHLACAALQYHEGRGGVACYFSMNEMPNQDRFSVESEAWFDDLSNFELVVLDNVDVWINSPKREQALFKLYNQFSMSGRQMLMTSRSVPSLLKLTMPDLSSRLKSGLLLNFFDLNDEEKDNMLCKIAEEKGLSMERGVSAYIIKRGSRDVTELISVMNVLDQASLVEKRKLTVPFVKKVLRW